MSEPKSGGDALDPTDLTLFSIEEVENGFLVYPGSVQMPSFGINVADQEEVFFIPRRADTPKWVAPESGSTT